MDTQTKTKNLRLRITPRTWEKMKELAEADTRNVTNWLEAIVDREYEKLKKRRG
jgi:hypothetical protein